MSKKKLLRLFYVICVIVSISLFEGSSLSPEILLNYTKDSLTLLKEISVFMSDSTQMAIDMNRLYGVPVRTSDRESFALVRRSPGMTVPYQIKSFRLTCQSCAPGDFNHLWNFGGVLFSDDKIIASSGDYSTELRSCPKFDEFTDVLIQAALMDAKIDYPSNLKQRLFRVSIQGKTLGPLIRYDQLIDYFLSSAQLKLQYMSKEVMWLTPIEINEVFAERDAKLAADVTSGSSLDSNAVARGIARFDPLNEPEKYVVLHDPVVSQLIVKYLLPDMTRLPDAYLLACYMIYMNYAFIILELFNWEDCSYE